MSNLSAARRAHPEPWTGRFARLFACSEGGSAGEGVRFVLFVALFALVALCGGASRADVAQLLVLRPGVVLIATALLLLPGPLCRPVLRAPGLLLAALALVIAVQLVPLPPVLWSALPGHGLYREAAAAAGVPQPWRPITLSVDLTLNSLVALGVPGAVLLGVAALRADQRGATAGLAIGVAVASALLGLLQVSGAALYLYAPTDVGRPVGLFANINHQAALLAAVIPVTAAWAVAPRRRGPRRRPLRYVVAAAAGVLLFATVLVSGSRGGLVLAVLAVLSVPLVIGTRVALPPRTRWLVMAGVVAAAAALVAATWAAGRLGGLDRLLGASADQRVTYLPVTLGLLRGYAPFGSGFGTFDAAFRQAEPDAILKLTYFNHAHNDLLELGITGGVAALAVMLAGVVWLARCGAIAFGAGQGLPTAPLARAGVFAAALLMLASLVDYPLRTPLAGALLVLAVLWVAELAVPARARVTTPE